MLRRLFLAPGYYLYRRFTKKRKKFRFVSKTRERGPVLRLSLMFWICASLVAAVCYGAMSGGGEARTPALPEAAVAPFPSALATAAEASPAAEPAPPEPPRLPTMAESAQMSAPESAPAPAPSDGGMPPSAGAQPGSAPQAGAAAGVLAATGETVAPAPSDGPGRLDGPVPASPATITMPRELIAPEDARAATGRLPEAWLVIVESIPKSKREEAEQAQARQKRKGVELSIMDTDAYPRLKSGLWALALGPYDSKKEAETAAAGIKPKVKDLMVRRGL